MRDFVSHHSDMDPVQLHDANVATFRGAMSIAVMAGAMFASSAERLEPALRVIGLMTGIVATTATIVNVGLTWKKQWTKSRRSRRH